MRQYKKPVLQQRKSTEEQRKSTEEQRNQETYTDHNYAAVRRSSLLIKQSPESKNENQNGVNSKSDQEMEDKFPNQDSKSTLRCTQQEV